MGRLERLKDKATKALENLLKSEQSSFSAELSGIVDKSNIVRV